MTPHKRCRARSGEAHPWDSTSAAPWRGSETVPGTSLRCDTPWGWKRRVLCPRSASHRSAPDNKKTATRQMRDSCTDVTSCEATRTRRNRTTKLLPSFLPSHVSLQHSAQHQQRETREAVTTIRTKVWFKNVGFSRPSHSAAAASGGYGGMAGGITAGAVVVDVSSSCVLSSAHVASLLLAAAAPE